MPSTVLTPERAWQGLDRIQAWVEVRFVDSDGAPQTYKWAGSALADPSDYYDGFKEERLISLGSSTRGLSDYQGQPEGSSCTVMLSDLPDQDSGVSLLRAFLANAEQEDVLKLEMVIRLAPDSDRRSGNDALTRFRGVVAGYSADTDFGFIFELEDPFQSKFGENVPLPRLGDLFPGAPTATKDLKGKLLYGGVTDENVGAAAPEIATEAVSGSNVGPAHVLGGALGRAGYGARGGTILTGFTMVDTPANGGHFDPETIDLTALTYYGMVTFTPDSTGVEGDPQNLLPVDCPTLAGLAGTDSTVDMACDPAGVSGTYNFYLGAAFNNYIEVGQVIRTATPSCSFDNTNADVPGGYLLSFCGWANLADGSRTAASQTITMGYSGPQRLARIVLTPVVGAVSYGVGRSRDKFGVTGGPGSLGPLTSDMLDRQYDVPLSSVNGDGNFVIDIDPLGSTEGAVAEVTSTAPVGLVPCRDVGQFTDLLGTIWEGFEVACWACKAVINLYIDGVLVTDYDGQACAPGQIGYTSRFGSDPYRVVNGYRVCMVYLRGGLLDGIVNSSLELRANVNGVEDVGDGTGDLIVNLLDIRAHFEDNFLLADEANAGGNWATTVPSWADTTPKRDETRWTSAKAALNALLSDMTGVWLLAQDISYRDALAQLNLSSLTDSGFTRGGASYVVSAIPNRSSATSQFTESDILQSTFKVTYVKDPGPFANRLPCAYRPVFNMDGGLTYERTKTENLLASQSKRWGIVTSPVMNFPARREGPIVSQMAQLRLSLSQKPYAQVTFSTGAHALMMENGDVIGISTRQGPASGGWDQHPVQSRRMTDQGNELTFDIESRDLIADVVSLDTWEEFMSERELGGDRHTSLVDHDDVTVRLRNWQEPLIPFGTFLGYGIVLVPTVYLWVRTETGSAQPKLYAADGSLLASGSAETASSFTLQSFVVPAGSLDVRTHIRFTLSGCTSDQVRAFGNIELRRM